MKQEVEDYDFSSAEELVCLSSIIRYAWNRPAFVALQEARHG